MRVAALGDVIFEVSDNAVKTLQSLEFSGAAQIQTHARHLQRQLAEFTGAEAEKITFSALLSRHLGADPDVMLRQIRQYTENGTALQFLLGTQKVGANLWLIKSYKAKIADLAPNGLTLTAEVTLSLIEYAKE